MLIAVHGLIGTRSQVVRQYRRLRVVLARELGERPLPDTEAIYRRALAETLHRARISAQRSIAGDAPPTLVVIAN